MPGEVYPRAIPVPEPVWQAVAPPVPPARDVADPSRAAHRRKSMRFRGHWCADIDDTVERKRDEFRFLPPAASPRPPSPQPGRIARRSVVRSLDSSTKARRFEHNHAPIQALDIAELRAPVTPLAMSSYAEEAGRSDDPNRLRWLGSGRSSSEPVAADFDDGIPEENSAFEVVPPYSVADSAAGCFFPCAGELASLGSKIELASSDGGCEHRFFHREREIDDADADRAAAAAAPFGSPRACESPFMCDDERDNFGRDVVCLANVAPTLTSPQPSVTLVADDDASPAFATTAGAAEDDPVLTTPPPRRAAGKAASEAAGKRDLVAHEVAATKPTRRRAAADIQACWRCSVRAARSSEAQAAADVTPPATTTTRSRAAAEIQACWRRSVRAACSPEVQAAADVASPADDAPRDDDSPNAAVERNTPVVAAVVVGAVKDAAAVSGKASLDLGAVHAVLPHARGAEQHEAATPRTFFCARGASAGSLEAFVASPLDKPLDECDQTMMRKRMPRVAAEAGGSSAVRALRSDTGLLVTKLNTTRSALRDALDATTGFAAGARARRLRFVDFDADAGSSLATTCPRIVWSDAEAPAAPPLPPTPSGRHRPQQESRMARPADGATAAVWRRRVRAGLSSRDSYRQMRVSEVVEVEAPSSAPTGHGGGGGGVLAGVRSAAICHALRRGELAPADLPLVLCVASARRELVVRFGSRQQRDAASVLLLQSRSMMVASSSSAFRALRVFGRCEE